MPDIITIVVAAVRKVLELTSKCDYRDDFRVGTSLQFETFLADKTVKDGPRPSYELDTTVVIGLSDHGGFDSSPDSC